MLDYYFAATQTQCTLNSDENSKEAELSKVTPLPLKM